MSNLGKILIVGAAGQLGRELYRAFTGCGTIVCIDRKKCDISNAGQVREMVRANEPDVILNAAAYTAVDRAETERELATAINATAPQVLAEEAKRRDALFVHYSTDYVFDGSKQGPWVETDTPNPLNHYGASKLAGEQAVAAVRGKHLIFRTTWVYGPHGNNFLLTMLRLGKEREKLNIVSDQFGAPTTSVALADATRQVVEGVLSGKFGPVENWAGLYHMTCGGVTNWCDFSKEIFARAKGLSGNPEVNPIPSTAYPTPAVRPKNSVLSNAKLQSAFGVTLPAWQEELDRVLSTLSLQPSDA